MYHDPQNGHNQPPHSQYPSAYHQPNAHNQPWPQPAYPQTPGPQPFPSAPPLLPPKPEPNSQWGADQALSPLIPPGPPPWMYPATDQTQRTNSLPTSTMSAVPRLGNAIPPEHVRMLDAGKHQVEASMMPTSPQFHLQPGAPSRFTPSPAPHGHNSSPQVFPQMGAMSPQMNNLSPLSPAPPPAMSAGDAARVRSYSHSYFTAPPPPPPIMNRGHTPVPAPPSHAPPLPHMQSEPHFSTTQQQHATTQSRHLSLPLYPQAPGTPAPNMLPPAPPTPAPPTPAPPTHTPAFPMPFASPHVPVRQDANAWVGGIAPRPNTHYRPFQPMPSIPQASPMGQPPPPPRAPPPPPPPPPPTLGIEMPVPMIGANGPPPLPPPPKHAVTSPTVLTHGPWSDGLHRSGTVTANKLPLPPKERAPTNELPLPPKVPVASPSTLAGAPSTSTVGNSPTLVASPLVSEENRNHEEELREALRLSLADSTGVRGTDEDEELRRALEASILEASFNDSGYVGHYDSPGGSSLNARSPVSRRTPPPEQDPVHALKPAPPLPRQESAPSALERASGSTIPLATSLPRAASSSSPVVGSAPSQVPPVSAQEDDEPPPPTYEEVTSSASRSPAMTNEPARPVLPVEPSAHSSPGPLFGAASRAPLHRSESYPRESRSPPPVAEPPVIEIIPPSHNNSLVRREPEQPAIQPVERPQNVTPPAEAPRAQSPPRRPEPVQRSATASPPAVPLPRAASHARPASETLPHAEYGGTGLARQRVMSASHASAGSASRMTRASMFFTGKNNSNSVPPTESPHRTWAIDEEPSGSSGGLMLQPPEPASTLLHSRNASKTNLNEVQADAPLVDDLLQGVSYGFRDPDPPSPVPMPPAQPFPPSIMIGENSAFHIQGPNFRHLLRLLSHYGGTNIQATPAAIAASKSGEHAARVVLYFIKGNHDRDPWLCRLFLELHTPGANETVPVADTSELWKDSTIQALAGPRGKLYVVPGPLPVLPLSFQGLSTFLVARLESATRAPSDSSPRRLERMLVECYGSVSGAAAAGEEIGGRQKGSGNISFGGLFSKVKDKFSSDKGGTTNIHTYDLISPFHVDEYR